MQIIAIIFTSSHLYIEKRALLSQKIECKKRKNYDIIKMLSSSSHSMRGGETMRTLLGIIVSIVVDIVGHLINKWLDKVSLSGSWKTLHGMVKRSLISKITSIKKRRAATRLFFMVKTMHELLGIMVNNIIPFHRISSKLRKLNFSPTFPYP